MIEQLGLFPAAEPETVPSPLCCRWTDCQPKGRAVLGPEDDRGGCINRSIRCQTCGKTGIESTRKDLRLALFLLVLLPALAHAQERSAISVRPDTGIVIDTFAADNLRVYLNPEQATGESVRLTAGFDFEYRIFSTCPRAPSAGGGSHDSACAGSPPRGSLWLIGSTRYGVRSADIDCQQNQALGVCQPFAGRRDAWLYVLRHARTVEASGGLRWEFMELGGVADPAVLYLAGRAGVLAVAGDGDDASDSHVAALGLLVTGGPYAGTYLEAGVGRSDVYATHAPRLKVDGRFYLGRARLIRPFLQVTLDADLAPGADSLQTNVGATFNLR